MVKIAKSDVGTPNIEVPVAFGGPFGGGSGPERLSFGDRVVSPRGSSRRARHPLGHTSVVCSGLSVRAPQAHATSDRSRASPPRSTSNTHSIAVGAAGGPSAKVAMDGRPYRAPKSCVSARGPEFGGRLLSGDRKGGRQEAGIKGQVGLFGATHDHPLRRVFEPGLSIVPLRALRRLGPPNISLATLPCAGYIDAHQSLCPGRQTLAPQHHSLHRVWWSSPVVNSAATQVLFVRAPGGNADVTGGVDRHS